MPIGVLSSYLQSSLMIQMLVSHTMMLISLEASLKYSTLR